MHEQEAMPYVVLGVAIYGFDHLLRVVRTRISTARIRSLPDLGMTRVEIRTIRTGWRAGQHVRVRFLTKELKMHKFFFFWSWKGYFAFCMLVCSRLSLYSNINLWTEDFALAFVGRGWTKSTLPHHR